MASNTFCIFSHGRGSWSPYGIIGYLGIWRGLSRAIWGFSVKLSGVIFPTSWIFLGNHDDLGLFGDLAWVI